MIRTACNKMHKGPSTSRSEFLRSETLIVHSAQDKPYAVSDSSEADPLAKVVAANFLQ